MISMCRVSLDRDCATTPHWLHRGGIHVWRAFSRDMAESVVVTWEDADKLEGMSKSLPGWNSGVVDHPHPLRFEDIDVEE